MALNQDPSAIIRELKMLDPRGLQNFAAANRGDTNMVALAVGESNRRKRLEADKQAQMAGVKPPPVVDQDIAQMAPRPQMAQLPEQQGIGALPAPNMQRMADGGIAGYGDDGSSGTFNFAGGGAGPVDGNPNGDLAYNNEPVLRMADGGIAHFAGGGLNDYIPQIVAEAKRLGIDPNVAINLFKTESGGNKNAVSGKGAAGLGQLMKPAAKEMGLSEEERFDPQKNISASLGYFKKQLDRFGDYDKAAAAYNWGPNNLKNHLAKNEGILDRLSLPKETAKYLTKLMPGREANAGELDGRFAAAQGQAAPQSQAAAPVEPRSQGQAMMDAGKGVVGAGETALQYLTGTGGMLLGGAAGVASQLPNVVSGKGANRQEQEAIARRVMGATTYRPRTDAGQEISEGTGRFLESDLKLPPYLAHMGNLSPTKSRQGVPLADLEALAAEKTRMAETPRLTGPGVSETMVQGKGELPVRNAEAVAKQLADIDEAKAWRDTVLEGKATKGLESNLPETIARNAELARAQAISAAGAGGARAGTNVESPANQGIAALTGDANAPDDIDVGGGFNPAAGAGNKETEKAAAGKSPNSRFNDDDLLMLGLGMMANNRPGTGNKLGDLIASAGQAGIGAVQAKREREKSEMDKEYKDILGKYYGSLGKKAEGEAALYASGEKFRMADRQKAAAAIEQEMAKWQQTAGMAAAPGAEARKRAELTNYYFNLFGLDVPDTISSQAPGSGFKVLGSRPAP